MGASSTTGPRNSSRGRRFAFQSLVQQGFDDGLIADAALGGEFAGSFDVGDGETHRDVFGGDGSAASVLEQHVGDQGLMAVPPGGLLGFGAEGRGVEDERSSPS